MNVKQKHTVLQKEKTLKTNHLDFNDEGKNVFWKLYTFGHKYYKPQIKPNSRRFTQIILFYNSKDAAHGDNFGSIIKIN